MDRKENYSSLKSKKGKEKWDEKLIDFVEVFQKISFPKYKKPTKPKKL